MSILSILMAGLSLFCAQENNIVHPCTHLMMGEGCIDIGTKCINLHVGEEYTLNLSKEESRGFPRWCSAEFNDGVISVKEIAYSTILIRAIARGKSTFTVGTIHRDPKELRRTLSISVQS